MVLFLVQRNDTLEGVFKRTSEYTSFADVVGPLFSFSWGHDTDYVAAHVHHDVLRGLGH